MTAELDPIPYLRSARERLVSFRPLEAALAGKEPGQPTAQDEFVDAFGLGLRASVDRYESENPDIGLHFIRYTRGVDDTVDLILDSGDDAPAEDDIVALTSSGSAADIDRLTIVAEVLVAARRKR